jgi:hypothetical protein
MTIAYLEDLGFHRSKAAVRSLENGGSVAGKSTHHRSKAALS